MQDRDGVRPVFLFPDHGTQYAGMAKELYHTHPGFRGTLDTCAALLATSTAQPLPEILWGSQTHLLQEPAYGHAALFAVEYALAQLWRSWGIEPAAVLGVGVGEYAAACVAGICSPAEALKLVLARASQSETEFRTAVAGARFQPPQLEVYSSVSGRPLRADDLREIHHFWNTGRVQNLAAAIHILRGAGRRVFVEAGPGSNLCLSQQTSGGEPVLCALSLRAGYGEWRQMLESLANLYRRGADVDWAAFDAPYKRRRVALPTYPFERQRYWLDHPACYPTPPRRQDSESHPLLGRRI